MQTRDFYKYQELRGNLGNIPMASAVPGTIAFSDLTRGTVRSCNASFALKYVARGSVYHRVREKTHVVRAGNFICVPRETITELDLKRDGETSMVGICVFLPQDPDPEAIDPALETPLVFPAACSKLGRMLAEATTNFQRPLVDRATNASWLLRSIAPQLEHLLEDTARSLASLTSAKQSTRLEALRRLNIARGHLHEVTDRVVGLEELARISGISRFQLLRDFRSCFGAPPGAYHRRIRLDLAKVVIERGTLNCEQAARQYGFGDGSSFSRAYAKIFGEPPVRTLRRT